MSNDAGFRLRLPDTMGDGCPWPSELKAGIEQSVIESAFAQENNAGTLDAANPLNYSRLLNQVEQLVSDNADLKQEIAKLGNAGSISGASGTGQTGDTSMKIAFPRTILEVIGVFFTSGTVPDDWKVSSTVGKEVTITWTDALTTSLTARATATLEIA